MSASILRRPSVYVALCAVIVVSAFIARGDLRIEDPSTRNDASRTQSGAPKVVHSNRRAPQRTAVAVVVAGRVLDALGYAVSGAEVTVVAGGTATTGPDGRFELSLSKVPFADLWIRGEGYSTRWLRTSLASPDQLVVRLEAEAPWDVEPAECAPPSLTGEGTVRNLEGKPVAGAYVTAAGSGLWSRTDDIGRYVLPLLDANPILLVHSDSLAARSNPLALARTHGVVPLPELVAESGAMIRGTLNDADGNPIEGVPVLIVGEGMSRLCESGTSGRFRVGGLLPGRYEVKPHAWSGALGRSQQVVLDRPIVECELRMEPLLARKVQVCRENGSPVARSYVAVFLEGTRFGVTRADDDGWAEVSLASGTVRFEVRGEDGASELEVRGFDREQTKLVVAAP